MKKKTLFNSTLVREGAVALSCFLFSTCSLFTTPVKGFLQYYSDSVVIQDYKIQTPSQLAPNGVNHLSTTNEAKIFINLVNPQQYDDLQGEFAFENSELNNLTGFNGITLKQNEYDHSLFEFSIPQNFLQTAEAQNKNNVSATIKVFNKHKTSQEFKLNLIANSPPPAVLDFTLMQTSGADSFFVLCFNIPFFDEKTVLDTKTLQISYYSNSNPNNVTTYEYTFNPNFTNSSNINFTSKGTYTDGSISTTSPSGLSSPTSKPGNTFSTDTSISIPVYFTTALDANTPSDYTYTVRLIDDYELYSNVENSNQTKKLAPPQILHDNEAILEQDNDYIAYAYFAKVSQTTDGVNISDSLKLNYKRLVNYDDNDNTGASFTGIGFLGDKITLYPGKNEIEMWQTCDGYLDSEKVTKTIYVSPLKLMVANIPNPTSDGLGTPSNPFISVGMATYLCSHKDYAKYNFATTPTIYIDNTNSSVELTETWSINIGNSDNNNPNRFSGIKIEPLNKTNGNTVTIKKSLEIPSFITAYKNLEISNITLDGQKDESDNQFAQQGGAININSGASVTTNNCIIKNFKAIHFGGGICNAGTYTDNGSTIKNCQSKAGGGIYTNGITTLNGTQIIENIATVTGTDTSNADGGGLFGENPSGGTYKITATDCIIKDNKVINSSTGNTGNAHGGGVHLKATSQNNSFTNCNFINNSVSYNYDNTYNSNALGGGLSVMSGNNTNTFTNCNFAGNVTTNNAGKFDGYGGAIYISDRNSTNDNPKNIFNNCTIGSCTIDGTEYGPNKARNGGGVHTGDNVTFNNCIIGNKAKENKDYTGKKQVVSSDNEQGYLANEDSAGNIALFGAALFCTWNSDKHQKDGKDYNPIVELNNTKVCFNYVVYENPTSSSFAYTGTNYTNESTCVIIMQGSPIVKLNNETQIFGNKNGYLFRMDHGSRLDILGNSKIHHNYASKKSVIWLNQNAQLWLSDGTIEYNNMEINGGACINAYPENDYDHNPSPTVNICGGTIKNNYRVDGDEGCYEIKIVKYTSGNNTRYGTLNFGTYDKDNSCGKIQIGNYSSTPSSLNKYDSIYIYDGCKINVSALSSENTNWLARIYLGATSPTSDTQIINCTNNSITDLSKYFIIVNYTNGLKTDSSGKLN